MEQVRALPEETRIEFLRYACMPNNAIDFYPLKGWLWKHLGFSIPSLSVWKRVVQLLPECPTDWRYIAIISSLQATGAYGEEKVEELEAPLRFCLVSIVKNVQLGIDQSSTMPPSQHTRRMLLELLASPYEDIELTLAVLEVVPFLYDEGFLPRLNVLLMGGKFSSERRQVVEEADRAYRCLVKNIKKKKENDALLRPVYPPNEANSLLRPAHDPIETKPEELLRPAEKQERDE